MRFAATPGWGPLAAVVAFSCGVWLGVSCVACVCGAVRAGVCVVCLWSWCGCGCVPRECGLCAVCYPGWDLLWAVPRHSWRRFLRAFSHHSWLGFAAGGGGCSSPLLAEGPGCGPVPLLAGSAGGSGAWLLATLGVVLVAVPRHSWLGSAGRGGGRFCGVCVCGAVRARVVSVRVCVSCVRGGDAGVGVSFVCVGVCVRVCGCVAEAGWGLPLARVWVVCCVPWLVPRHSWRRFLSAISCHSWLGFAVGGGGCSSPLLTEEPLVRFPATPGWGPLMAMVCGRLPLLAAGPGCGSPPLLAGGSAGGGGG